MMFSARSCSPAEMKIFCPADGIASVGARRRLGGQQAKVRAALRLGEIHRAGPGARRHFWRVETLLLLAAVAQQRRERALGEPRIHGEGHIRRRGEFIGQRAQRVREPLPAVFLRRRQPDPTALGQGAVGGLEALRGGHARVVVANAALFISDLIERPHDFLGELGRLAENLGQHLARDISEPRKLTKLAEIQNIAQQKNSVVHRGLVTRHRALQQ